MTIQDWSTIDQLCDAGYYENYGGQQQQAGKPAGYVQESLQGSIESPFVSRPTPLAARQLILPRLLFPPADDCAMRVESI
jgi:hypothetical protein